MPFGGKGSGIGRSITLDLVSRGLGVFIVGRRLEKLQETVGLSKHPDNIVIIHADVSKEEGRNKIKQAIGDHNLRFLIHNAGIVGPLKSIKNVEIQEYRQVMETNVEAPIFLTKLLIPTLEQSAKKNGISSRILHVSSGCAHRASGKFINHVYRTNIDKLYEQRELALLFS